MDGTKEGRVARLRRRIGGTVAGALAMVSVSAGMAFATPPDPAGEAATGAFADVQDMFLTVIVPAAVGLTVAILAIVLALKWIKRTAKTA